MSPVDDVSFLKITLFCERLLSIETPKKTTLDEEHDVCEQPYLSFRSGEDVRVVTLVPGKPRGPVICLHKPIPDIVWYAAAGLSSGLSARTPKRTLDEPFA